MGFLKRGSVEKRPGPPDPDLAAIDEMRHAGADLGVPHKTRHFIYVPGVKAAQHLARILKSPSRYVEIDTSARRGYWLVVVGQSMVVTPGAISALRTELEAAAKLVGGEYDRWQVELEGG